MRKMSLISIFVGLVIFPLSCVAQSELVLNFGIYSSVKPTELITKFTPVTKAIQASLSETLKRPVAIKFQVAAKYQDGIKDILDNKADFSRLGPSSYIEAIKENPRLSIFAMESKKGSTTDYGIICVKEDSPIKSVEELRGKSFAFGDEMSTIGRYLSQQFLLTHGLKASDLSKYEYLGRHDAVGMAVGSGRFDAGAIKEETFTKLKASGTALRELARFPNQSQAWVARAGLAEDVKAALKKAVLGLNDPEALKAVDADKIVEGQDKDFATVRVAMEANPNFFK